MRKWCLSNPVVLCTKLFHAVFHLIFKTIPGGGDQPLPSHRGGNRFRELKWPKITEPEPGLTASERTHRPCTYPPAFVGAGEQGAGGRGKEESGRWVCNAGVVQRTSPVSLPELRWRIPLHDTRQRDGGGGGTVKRKNKTKNPAPNEERGAEC